MYSWGIWVALFFSLWATCLLPKEMALTLWLWANHLIRTRSELCAKMSLVQEKIVSSTVLINLSWNRMHQRFLLNPLFLPRVLIPPPAPHSGGIFLCYARVYGSISAPCSFLWSQRAKMPTPKWTLTQRCLIFLILLGNLQRTHCQIQSPSLPWRSYDFKLAVVSQNRRKLIFNWGSVFHL